MMRAVVCAVTLTILCIVTPTVHAVEAETHVVETEAPIVEADVPVDETELPVDETELPVDEEAPIDDEEALISDTTTPVVEAGDGMAHMPRWNAAKIVREELGIPTLEYSAWGLGRYPWLQTMPGARMRVRIDGVPVPSISPFGPDLERIPAHGVASVLRAGRSEIDIAGIDGLLDIPRTDTRFFIGPRRRFVYDLSLRRKIGERTGLVITGSSSGTHGSPDTVKNSLRSYAMRVDRLLEDTGRIIGVLSVGTDRDGLVDLTTYTGSAERKTSMINAMIGLRDYRLGERTVVSPTAYYISGLSRFDRYGTRKSMDDDMAGVDVPMVRTLGNTSYGLRFTHDTRRIDSRIHTKDWTIHESRFIASFDNQLDRFSFSTRGGVQYSSEYDAGWLAEGSISVPAGSMNIVARGSTGREFPDWAGELYLPLVFNPAVGPAESEAYNYVEGEAGFKIQGTAGILELLGWFSSAEMPLPATALSYMPPTLPPTPLPGAFPHTKNRTLTGLRGLIDAETSWQYPVKFHADWNRRFEQEVDDDLWPWPIFDSSARMSVRHSYLGDNLRGMAFLGSRILSWDGGTSMTPQGNHLLLDAGLVISVSTLELFYHIDNITGENICWYDTLGWDGRTPVWGISWRLDN
jgi:hypothetical protein